MATPQTDDQLVEAGRQHLLQLARAERGREARLYALRHLVAIHKTEYQHYRTQYIDRNPQVSARFNPDKCTREQLARYGFHKHEYQRRQRARRNAARTEGGDMRL